MTAKCGIISTENALFALGGGLIGGFINGLIGAGAGIVTVFLSRALLPDAETRDCLSLSLTSVFAVSLVSASEYLGGGRFDINALLPYALPAVAGGVLGSYLLGKMSGGALRRVFAAVTTAGGAIMLLR